MKRPKGWKGATFLLELLAASEETFQKVEGHLQRDDFQTAMRELRKQNGR